VMFSSSVVWKVKTGGWSGMTEGPNVVAHTHAYVHAHTHTHTHKGEEAVRNRRPSTPPHVIVVCCWLPSVGVLAEASTHSANTRTHARTHAYMQPPTRPHTHAHTHTNSHPPTHPFPPTPHPHPDTHVHAHTHSHSHSHTHTRAHIRTHTHTHTHTHNKETPGRTQEAAHTTHVHDVMPHSEMMTFRQR
jgi:hypothetical protein